MESLTKQVVSALLADHSNRSRIGRIQQTVGQLSKYNTSVSCFTEVSAYKTARGHYDLIEFSYPGAPCFAALPNAGGYEATPIAVVAGVMPQAFKEVSGSVLRDFFLWAENESPFKDAVYDHRINVEMGTGTIVVRGDKDARLVVGALIAVRCANEYPDIVYRWDKLQTLGFNRTASFLFAHFLDVVDGKPVMGQVRCSHVSLNVSGMCSVGVKGFLSGKIAETKKDNLLYFEKDAYYHGVHDLWGEWNGEETIVRLASELADRGREPVKSAWGGKREAIPFCPLEMCNVMGLDATTVLVPRFLAALEAGGAKRAIKGGVEEAVKDSKPLTARTLREHALQRHLRVRDQDADCMCEGCVKAYRLDWLRDHPLAGFEEAAVEAPAIPDEAPPILAEPVLLNLEPGHLVEADGFFDEPFQYPDVVQRRAAQRAADIGVGMFNAIPGIKAVGPEDAAKARQRQKRNWLDLVNNNIGIRRYAR